MNRTSTREPRRSRQHAERGVLLATRAFIDDMRARYRDLEKHTGASISMHRALACIATDPGISASVLANALGMKRPATSHALKGLAERGWIERRRILADQRAVQLHLTPAGKQIVASTSNRAVGTLQRAVSQLSDAEVMALASGLAALLRELPASAGDGTGIRKPVR